MDWDHINLLLDVVHKSIGVLNTDKIRQAAMDALAVHNAGNHPDDVTDEPDTQPEPESIPSERRV